MDIEEADTTPIDTPPVVPEPEHKANTRVMVFWILGLLFAFVVGLGAGYLIWARPLKAELKLAQESATKAAESAQSAQAQGTDNSAQQQEVKRYDVPIDDDPILGADTAKITIIEFSDYQCPFCRQWHEEVLPQLKAKYGDKIRLVYRDFPLYSIHKNAESAAIAANCAGEQKRYWDYGDLLFSHQDSLSTQTYEKLAQDLKLDLPGFTQCITENRYKTEVDADFNYASELGVRSTPTFFINGLAVVGAQPFEVFQQIIDMELAGKIP